MSAIGSVAWWKAEFLAVERRLAELESEKNLCRAERDAALADNAALLFIAIEASSAQGAERLKAEPHPGAALLEEHRKALVRARNEGLEKAASLCTDWRGVEDVQHAIRAMIKPVPCCERDRDGDGNCDRHPRTAP